MPGVRHAGSPVGKITSYRFYAALMFSRARLTYTQVAAFIEAGYQGFDSEVADSLRALHQAYKALLAAREEHGALDFDAPEQKLILENGLLERIEPVVRNDAHRLIEEAMISANVCAARFLEKHEALALYRIHEGPTPEKFDLLRSLLAHAGIRLSDEPPTPALLAVRCRPVDRSAGSRVARDDDPALDDAGALQPEKHWPFRSGAAALHAFHVADPPLCGSRRASRDRRRAARRNGGAAGAG